MRESPAAQRNRAPIADVLADELPHAGRVLEIASGTGEHVVHFAARFPNFDWHPTDPQQEALASIAAYREASGLDNVRPPVALEPPGLPESTVVVAHCEELEALGEWSLLCRERDFLAVGHEVPPQVRAC